MIDENALTRAKKLVLNGRYQVFHVKHLEPFLELESMDRVVVGGKEYMPYFHKTTQQIVYGYHEQVNGQIIFHYLAFSKFDYFYGSDDSFIWFDKDDFGFTHL
ncbi:MAG: hypothetical protein ACNA7U_03975 [Candidatus Izemoplasmataceae bacterium]|uniref:hypothetical protein n=1 Tax=Liberiplasma polymorphum TaxID=3374570 RepID=UPI0037733C6B